MFIFMLAHIYWLQNGHYLQDEKNLSEYRECFRSVYACFFLYLCLVLFAIAWMHQAKIDELMNIKCLSSWAIVHVNGRLAHAQNASFCITFDGITLKWVIRSKQNLRLCFIIRVQVTHINKIHLYTFRYCMLATNGLYPLSSYLAHSDRENEREPNDRGVTKNERANTLIGEYKGNCRLDGSNCTAYTDH